MNTRRFMMASIALASLLGLAVVPALTSAQTETADFEFYYHKSGGIAGIQKEISYDSGTGVINVHDSMTGTHERTLTAAEASRLESLIIDHGFFDIQEEFAASSEAADYFSYSLTVRSGANNHTVTWVDPFASSTEIPPALATISTAIERVSGERDNDMTVHPSLNKRRITGTVVIDSVPHDAVGHESHQASYILYPQAEFIYSGKITFSSTRPVDIMVYHDVSAVDTSGIGIHEVGGRSYAVTTVLNNVTSGSIDVVGAGILAHTFDSNPYTVIASIDALRKTTTVSPVSPIDPAPQETTFTVDVLGETFTVRVTDQETISQMIDNYNDRNEMHVTGQLAEGSGDFNEPWSWHLVPESVRMAEVSIELCDGMPSFVEEDLDYWLNTVGTYCPWPSKVVAIHDNGDGDNSSS